MDFPYEGLVSRHDIESMPSKIYKKPCAKCPSYHHGHDPETRDIYTWGKTHRIALVFPCAWRQNKLCYGICQLFNVTEEDVERLKEANRNRMELEVQ